MPISSPSTTPIWTAETAVLVYRSLFQDAPIVVASNREPYTPRRDVGGGVSYVRPAGGLTSALDPVMQALGGTWVAWGAAAAGGGSAAAEWRQRLAVPPDDPKYEVRRIRLSETEVRNYYHGYSNESLWPLCHSILEHVRFRDRFWRAYQDVNRKFAVAVLEEAEDDSSLIWVQDYHLALLAAEIRVRRPASRLAHFWHIPWPSWDMFRMCPNHRELLTGLLANDLLGFHLESFCDNFLRCCEQDLDVLVDWHKRAVVHSGHVTALGALPISIDADSFRELASGEDTRERIRELRARFGLLGRKIGIGVDRLDYSKGILERLDALRILFTRHPQHIGRFTFIQVGAPSRTEIPAYAELQKRIEHAVRKLNQQFGREGWEPVLYVAHGVPQEELAALYRMADVAVVSSIQDGMNLVAKEFVAAQVEDPGVLCLSEFAGAAEEFGHAIIVNPLYTEGFAEDIHRALIMEPAEKRARMERMQATLQRGNVYRWIADFLGAAREAVDLGGRSSARPAATLPPPASTESPRGRTA